MNNTWYLYLFFSAALVFAGLYALLAKRNLIKLFIGDRGHRQGREPAPPRHRLRQENILVAQALVVTFIVIEVSLVATALAIIINIYRHTKSLDVRKLAKLKG